MNTPITDDQTRHVFQWNDKRGKYLPAGIMVDANLARRLELDRAALINALMEIHQESEMCSYAENRAFDAISSAHANFPTK